MLGDSKRLPSIWCARVYGYTPARRQQRKPHPWAFKGGAGQGITTPGSGTQCAGAASHCIHLHGIQKQVYCIAPQKVGGKITHPQVSPGACGKVQPAARFVKGDRGGETFL